MPYDSASGAYIRRTTTILDETPDGDTVNTAVAGKLDTTVDDSVADLNHHRVNGGHYPSPSVSAASRYLKQAPSGAVSWGEGVPIEQAALKDLSNVPVGTTASINITGNAATATACTGNAATASDMVAGHVLAGKTTSDGVWGAVTTISKHAGRYSYRPISRASEQAVAGGAVANIATNAATIGDLPVTNTGGLLSWDIAEDGDYLVEASITARAGSSTATSINLGANLTRGGTASRILDTFHVSNGTTDYVSLHASRPVKLVAGDTLTIVVSGGSYPLNVFNNAGYGTLTRLR